MLVELRTYERTTPEYEWDNQCHFRSQATEEIRSTLGEEAEHVHDETTPVQQQQVEKAGSTEYVVDISHTKRTVSSRRLIQGRIRTEILRGAKVETPTYTVRAAPCTYTCIEQIYIIIYLVHYDVIKRTH